MKNCNKKFVVGFPVDAGEKADPFYYLVLRDKNKFNQGIKSSSGFRKLESINDSQMDHILKKLNEERKYLVFVSSSEKQGDLIPDALPDGNSSTLACLLAGYKEDISYENYSEKSKNPVIMVSCSIYGKPESLKEAQLSRVTSSDSDFSKNSLKRKWNAIKNIQKGGTPVAFILHNDDFTLIKEVLSPDEYEEKSIDEITELFDDGKKKPFLVSVETEDFKKLARQTGSLCTKNIEELLKIDGQKKEIKRIFDEEIKELEGKILNENDFREFIKDSVKKTIEEAGVNILNILFKKDDFTNSIKINLAPKVESYLKEKMEDYKRKIEKRLSKKLEDLSDCLNNNISNKTSNDASSNVGISVGAAIGGAVGAAIAAAFVQQVIFLFINVINWYAVVVMVVFALISLSGGWMAKDGLATNLIKIIGPSKKGIIYKLWFDGIKYKDNAEIKSTGSLKEERLKDYDRLIKNLEETIWSEFFN